MREGGGRKGGGCKGGCREGARREVAGRVSAREGRERRQQRGREHTGEGRERTQEREGESKCAGAGVRESAGLRKGECRQQGESTWGEQAQGRAQA